MVIPASVKYIDGNAFKGFYGKSNETTGDDKLSLILTGSNNPLPSTGLSNVTVSSVQSDTPGNTVILRENAYNITYGYLKEGVFSDGTVQVVRATAADGTVELDKSGYKNTEATLVREYYVPQIGIDKTTSGIDLDNVETVELRYVEEDGLRKYTMVVGMKDATTYVARNVAVITEASVRYGDYNRYGYQEVSVYMNPDIKNKNYANLKGMNYQVKYKKQLVAYKQVPNTTYFPLYMEDTSKPTITSDTIKESTTLEYNSMLKKVQWTIGTVPDQLTDENAPGYNKNYTNVSIEEDGFNRVVVTELTISQKIGTEYKAIYKEYYNA